MNEPINTLQEGADRPGAWITIDSIGSDTSVRVHESELAALRHANQVNENKDATCAYFVPYGTTLGDARGW